MPRRPLRLTSIRVSLLSPEILMITQQNIDTLTSFTCRSNRLRKGEADQEAQGLWYRQLFTILEMVPQLTDLSIGPAVLIDPPTVVFSKVARSLKSLELDRVKVADRSWYDDTIQSSQALSTLDQFPELETLVMVWNDLPPPCQLELIRKSPKLKSLAWKRSTKFLFEAWLSSTLPPPAFLSTLDVAHSHIGDEDMARILAMAPRLTSLNVRSTPFGPQSYAQLLENHAPKIVMLDVADCPQVSSEMVMTLLSSLPALLRFSASRVLAEDIARLVLHTMSRGLTPSQSWVCRDLMELEISIVGLHSCENPTPAQARCLILERLSELKRLEVLCLGEDVSTLGPEEEWLDLTLAHDLDKLSSLTMLKTLNIRNLKAKMGKDEIDWMARTWGKLEVVRGKLNGDLKASDARALARQLRSVRPDIVYSE
ncbi:hypothetical protein BGZ95_002384 [Linnemannia exigua]|uniref:RNI-like protein n=1 Tax=Linnemannia exigua TaxID=604196 RepID=A0AAD4H235_9FUNG|nr:hypothetical protein BGZ95_002384 [Linnemannia exigua]